MSAKALLQWIEAQAWVDHLAVPIRNAVRKGLDQLPLLDRVLRGIWLGHPLHPALVTLPIGFWSAALVLDALDLLGKKGFQKSADVMTLFGLVSVVPTAAAGLADFSRTTDLATRVSLFHAVLNVAVGSVYLGSLFTRIRGQRRTAIALSLLGYGLLLGSGWLGGELAYAFHVGQS